MVEIGSDADVIYTDSSNKIIDMINKAIHFTWSQQTADFIRKGYFFFWIFNFPVQLKWIQVGFGQFRVYSCDSNCFDQLPVCRVIKITSKRRDMHHATILTYQINLFIGQIPTNITKRSDVGVTRNHRGTANVECLQRCVFR